MFKRVRYSIILAWVVAAVVVTSVGAVAGTLLYSGGREASYSRVIKLASGNIIAVHSVIISDTDGGLRVYKSTNNGASFTFLTEFVDGTGKITGVPDIIEATNGTILMAYQRWNDADLNAGEDLKIARSTNEGSSWTVIATLETPPTWNWEPEFYKSSDGKLQIFYSYSAAGGHQLEQVIARRESADNGATWGARTYALGADAGPNYGMPRVAKCGSTYYMAVENYEDLAAVWVYSSSDGKTGWTNGHNMEKAGDGWMQSSPELVCMNGALYGTGLLYKDAAWWMPDDENCGKKILKSTNGGTSWTEVNVPVTYTCNGMNANYSPGFLPLSNTSIFEITNTNVNTVKFGTQTGY